MAVTMELGGVNLGSNFPLVSRTYEPIRVSEQGPSFKKVTIILSGFVEGLNSEEVVEVTEIIAAIAALNDTLFTYINGGETLYDDKKVYISGYSEPQDAEHARNRAGDYSISLYYFENSLDDVDITCTYGAYTFDKTPKWGRDISQNRESPRGELRGSTATITLSGVLYEDNHSDLMASIAALTAAFNQDALLTYGVFAQTVRSSGVSISEEVMSQYAYFSVNLSYDIGEVVELRKKRSFSRIHNNPVITDQPFCDTRIIDFMNLSGQFVTYRMSLAAETIATARGLLSTELAGWVEPGGIEMPGGTEDWDEDNASVQVSIIKFYNTGILANIP